MAFEVALLIGISPKKKWRTLNWRYCSKDFSPWTCLIKKINYPSGADSQCSFSRLKFRGCRLWNQSEYSFGSVSPETIKPTALGLVCLHHPNCIKTRPNKFLSKAKQTQANKYTVLLHKRHQPNIRSAFEINGTTLDILNLVLCQCAFWTETPNDQRANFSTFQTVLSGSCSRSKLLQFSRWKLSEKSEEFSTVWNCKKCLGKR